jgi:hypothetical protein
MTFSTTETLATSLAKHELSIDELETIAAGTPIMSGAPNSIQIAFQRGPTPPPRIWSGGAPHGVIHMAAF